MNERMRCGLSGGIVVTGGGSGIGRAAALASAQLGGKVAVLDIDESAATSTAAEAQAAGAPDALGLHCDVCDEASVAKAVALAVDRLGPLRGLVTAAAIDRGGVTHELELERWQAVLAANLTGTFLACKYVLGHMIARRTSGSIVCISSPFGEVCAPGGVASYSASKGGVSAFVRSLAIDYAPYSIRVNAVLPGATETALMWANVPAEAIPEMRDRIGRQLPLGRLAEPREIAAGITWLLSDQASYVTGSKLVIDGGLMARASIDI